MNMASRSRRSRKAWQRADHNLAVATVALLAFLVIAGTTAWLVGEKPNTAAAAPRAHSTGASK
jgi:hypothetical protein